VPQAASKPPSASPPEIKTIEAPFTVLTDSREQHAYTFTNFWDGPIGGPKSRLIKVPTRRVALPVGDYSIEGMEDLIILERKSKADLYQSISRARENFVGRLERMSRTYAFAAVVVEAGWDELLSDPPRHTQFSPKSLTRTILAWMTRYPVHWLMQPSRAHAEAFTFRILERFHKDQQERPRERFDPWEADEPMNDPARES
jgi:ERCC4-type nuclease